MNINISYCMVHAQHVEESWDKRKSRHTKRANFFDRVSSKGRLEIQDKPSFKRRVSKIIPSKFPKNKYNRVSNTNSHKGRTLVHQTFSLLVSSVEKVM